jgi:hypothetical protein
MSIRLRQIALVANKLAPGDRRSEGGVWARGLLHRETEDAMTSPPHLSLNFFALCSRSDSGNLASMPPPKTKLQRIPATSRKSDFDGTKLPMVGAQLRPTTDGRNCE